MVLLVLSKLEEVDTAFTRRAIEFMSEVKRKNPDQPFFVYLPLSSPHAPWLPPEFVKGKGQAGSREDLVCLVDWCVGEILYALEGLKLTEETLVIVTSDNGPRRGLDDHKSAGPLRGYKSHIWEGGHRVPFIARWPGRIQSNTINNEMICLTDLMATFASMVGETLPPHAGEDSYNIYPALVGEKMGKPIREALVMHSENGTFAIRQEKWKLILDNKTSGGWVEPAGKPPKPGAPGQLYNLEEDPYEQNDLWDAHPEIVEKLTKLLERYKKEGRSAPLLEKVKIK